MPANQSENTDEPAKLSRVELTDVSGEDDEMAADSIIDDGPKVGRVETLQRPQEVGSWSLDYLGPGFHASIRIARRGRGAQVGGWLTPPLSGVVVLVSLIRKPIVLETVISESGRFEFLDVPTGPCRLTFTTSHSEAPSMTPPLWV